MEGPPATHKPCCVCQKPGGKHCTKCKSRHYCGKACQLVDWNERGHKAQCKHMAAEFQDRLLDSLMPEKKPKEEPAIVEDVLLSDVSKAAARLSAVRLEKRAIVETGAPNDGAPSWRGICAICLDLLPIENKEQTFYSCCCKRMCAGCWKKCREYDARCPLCRAPACTSTAEWLRRLQKHVDADDADAQFQLAVVHQNGLMGLEKSPKRAFQYLELAAAQRHATAEFQIGQIYWHGEGVNIDKKQAAQWYRRAAEQGYPHAQRNLGLMFDQGEGVAQSDEEAARWWRLAAAQGDADALYNLGVCYQNGDGVSQNSHEALRCYKRAVAKGRAGAAADVAEVEAYLTACSDRQP